jgi:outer membrane protein
MLYKRTMMGHDRKIDARGCCLPQLLALMIVVSWCAAIFADVVKLTPDEVKRLAATQNTMIKESELGIKAQESVKKSAFTGFFPTVNASASATHMVTQPKFEMGGGGGNISIAHPELLDNGDAEVLQTLGSLFNFSDMAMSPENIYSYGLTIAQPFFTGGKILNAYRIQNYSLAAQKFTHERTKTEIGYAALSLYWGYIASLKGLEATTETRQWFETLVGDQQKMFRNGLIIELDVLNSTIQLDNFKLLETKMQDMIHTIGSQLLLFLGLPSNAVIEVDTANLRNDEGADMQPVTADSVEAWLAVRDDLRAMQCQLDVMRCLRKIQKAAYAPTVTGFVNLARSNQYSISDEKKFNNTSSFGVSLNWALFDWGKGLREMEKTGYQAEALTLQISNMRDQVKLKKMELARKVAQSVQTREIAHQDVAIATKALDIARIKYDAQAITSTELLTARNQLTNKTFAYAQACINVKLALEEYAIAPLSSGQSASAGSPESGSSGSGGGEQGK